MNQYAMETLRGAIENAPPHILAKMRERGPVRLIDAFVKTAPDSPECAEAVRSVLANRPAAERYAATLLGMM
jgi:hypothetical protein